MAREPDKRRPRHGQSGRPPAGQARPPAVTNWDHVAAWYDRLVGEEGSDYHRHVILPTALSLLEVRPGERLLDLACGQGVFSRLLAEHGAGFVLGVDASARLIAAARARGDGGGRIRYAVGDARELGTLADGSFDGAACLMAVHDLDPIEPVFAELARALRPGGRVVLVMMHPCFRVPRQSQWGWDQQNRIQYRRLDRYATPMSVPIATHPGAEPGRHTMFFHRPLAAYVNALASAGLAITACQEPLTHRRTEPGGRSRGENRAKGEFPVFLGLRAVKLS